MSKKEKIGLYIIGPYVTGKPMDNIEAFELARKQKLDKSLRIYIPHDFIPSYKTWEQSTKKSLRFMLSKKVDVVYALKGWSGSKGATTEVETALKVGIPVLFEED